MLVANHFRNSNCSIYVRHVCCRVYAPASLVSSIIDFSLKTNHRTEQSEAVVNGDYDDVILSDNMADVDVSTSGAVRPAVNVQHHCSQP